MHMHWKLSPGRTAFVIAATIGGIVVGRAAQQPEAVPAAVTAARCVVGVSPSTGTLTLATWAQGSQLLPGLGVHQHPVTTGSGEAHRYFDQGLRLIYAFNHDEAARAFARSVQLDPHCALCWWGLGEALGPNYNMPAMPERWQLLWQAVQAAQRESATATPVEQSLIGALGKRYKAPQPLDPAAMQPFNVAYADAMREVAGRFPDDDDVQVFFAEALMTANPWKLWSTDGQPAPGTAEIVATLEKVLARNPAHPGANHYYIHAVEASPHPDKALAAAARLPQLMPGAGHIVHMPAHIYQRVGRYADASAANSRAVTADLSYVARAKPPAYSYYGMYLAHNYQFLAYSAAMEGRSAVALEATRRMGAAIPKEVVQSAPGLDWYLGERYFALIRFGRWQEMLAEPTPDPAFTALTAAYLYARAVALAATKKLTEAKAEKAKLDELLAKTPADMPAGLNNAHDVFGVASLVADARIASAEGRRDDAVAQLREAVAREDKLAYDEPADWFFPVRHLLGAELLNGGKPADAEVVYTEDLRHTPNNGWALRGLAQALRAQNKAVAADDAEGRLRKAWAMADVTPTTSAF